VVISDMETVDLYGLDVQALHMVDAVVEGGDRGEIRRQLEPWEGEEGPMQWQW
jgi:hypothetical protein